MYYSSQTILIYLLCKNKYKYTRIWFFVKQIDKKGLVTKPNL